MTCAETARPKLERLVDDTERDTTPLEDRQDVTVEELPPIREHCERLTPHETLLPKIVTDDAPVVNGTPDTLELVTRRRSNDTSVAMLPVPPRGAEETDIVAATTQLIPGADEATRRRIALSHIQLEASTAVPRSLNPEGAAVLSAMP